MPELSLRSSCGASPLAQSMQQHQIQALRRIVVEELGDTVVLFGTVSTYYLKQLAQETVLPLIRDRRLFNRIEVTQSNLANSPA